MKRVLCLVIFFFTIGLTSCGGAGGPTTTLDITMTDFQFTPNKYNVPAGEEITLNIRNTGAVVHNFIIMKLGTTAGATFEDDDEANVYWGERDIQPGGDLSVTFTAPTEPGEYEVICRTHGHIASGMIGKLTVVVGE